MASGKKQALEDIKRDIPSHTVAGSNGLLESWNVGISHIICRAKYFGKGDKGLYYEKV
jgi:hypothetical protein